MSLEEGDPRRWMGTHQCEGPKDSIWVHPVRQADRHTCPPLESDPNSRGISSVGFQSPRDSQLGDHGCFSGAAGLATLLKALSCCTGSQNYFYCLWNGWEGRAPKIIFPVQRETRHVCLLPGTVSESLKNKEPPLEISKSTQQARALNPTPRFTDSVDTDTLQHPKTHHPSPNTISLNHPRLYRQLQRCLCISLCSRGTSNQALQEKGGVQDPQSRKVSPCGALQRWTDSKYQGHSFPRSSSCLKIIPFLGALSPAGSQTYMSNGQHCGLQRTVLMGAHLPKSPCINHTCPNHICPYHICPNHTCLYHTYPYHI